MTFRVKTVLLGLLLGLALAGDAVANAQVRFEASIYERLPDIQIQGNVSGDDLRLHSARSLAIMVSATAWARAMPLWSSLLSGAKERRLPGYVTTDYRFWKRLR